MNIINSFIIASILFLNIYPVSNQSPNYISIKVNKKIYIDNTIEKFLTSKNKNFKIEKKELNIFKMKAYVEISKLNNPLKITANLKNNTGNLTLKSDKLTIHASGHNVNIIKTHANLNFSGNWEGKKFTGKARVQKNNTYVQMVILANNKIFINATIKEINNKSLIDITIQTNITTKKARLDFNQIIINKITHKILTERINEKLNNIHKEIAKLIN